MTQIRIKVTEHFIGLRRKPENNHDIKSLLSSKAADIIEAHNFTDQLLTRQDLVLY